jgi:hypothetical protein
MLAWFRALVERVKTILLHGAALDLQADFLARHAERQAELLRRAAVLEAEGLQAVADELRQQAEALDPRQPLTLVMSTLQQPATTEQSSLHIAEGTGIQPESAGRQPTVRLSRPTRKGS